MADSLGPFEFRAWRGTFETLKRQLLTFARPGIEGTEFWNTGKRGKQFTVRSLAGVDDMASGRQTLVGYTMLIGAEPQSVGFCGTTSEAEGWRAVVLDVREVRLQAVLSDTGGAGAILECDWDLVPVAIEGVSQ